MQPDVAHHNPQSLSSRGLTALILLGAVAALILASAPPVLAHSDLVSAVPAPDEVATGPTDQLTLTFAQPIDVLDGSIRIMDQSGAEVPRGSAVGLDDDITVTVEVEPPLTTGTYTVAWRVIGGDGHPIEGTYSLGVDGGAIDPSTSGTPVPAGPAPVGGDPSAVAGDVGGAGGSTADSQATAEMATMATTADDGAGQPSPAAETVQTVARWLAFLGILAAIGVITFGIAVHPDSPQDQHILTQIAVAASVVTVAASLAQLLAHVAVVAGSGLPGLASGDAWTIVAGGGTFTATTVRIGAGALIGVAATGAQDWSHRPAHAVPLILGALGLLASFQFTGHTVTSAPSLIVRAADAAHVIGAGVWSGGAFALAAVMRSRRRRGSDSSLIVGRFSVAATGAVVLVGLAGTALAVVELDSVGALFTSSYGQILLGKLAVVGLVGAAGAYNHTRLVPAIVGGNPGAALQMQRIMRMELSLFPLAIALTAVLVRTSA